VTGSDKSGRPRLACEIMTDRVVAARASAHGDAVEVHSTRSLPPGAVNPNLAGDNVADAETVKAALSDALNVVGTRGRDIIAVLPDACLRVLLLDFDTLPDRPQDALGVVRFRLKKALPFDLDKASVTYHAFRDNGTVRVVAAVALTSVIEEYESLFRQLGYNPGVVLPSSVGALAQVDDERPTLLVKVDTLTTTLAIVASGQVLLFRTLDNAAGANVAAQQLMDDIYPAIIFFEDTYHQKIELVTLAGLPIFNQVGAALETQFGVPVMEISARSAGEGFGGSTTPPSMLASVVGALIG